MPRYVDRSVEFDERAVEVEDDRLRRFERSLLGLFPVSPSGPREALGRTNTVGFILGTCGLADAQHSKGERSQLRA